MPKNLEHVIYEKKGHVAYVTINRPDVLNALHSYAYADLRACWRDIALDPNVYCGIFTGAGKAFCAGRDVKFLAEHQAKGIRTPHEDPNNPLFHWGGGGKPSNVNLEKPLIAAINGLAVGVGFSLALATMKRFVNDGVLPRGPAELAARYGAELAAVRNSADAAEGVRAFKERRKPNWKLR